MSLEFNLISSDKYCTYITDGTHGTHINQESGKYLLSAKDILDGVVHIKENSRVISEEDFNKIHKNYKLENYDVLLTVAGTIGRTAIIRNYKNNYTFQRSVAIFKTNDKLKSLWLYYYLNSPIGKQIVKSLSKGTTQLILPLKDLRNLEIPVPKNIEDQKKILSILVNIDKKIEVNKKINKNLEKTLITIFNSWFINFENYDNSKGMKIDDSYGEIPVDWSVEMLEDYVDFVTGVEPGSKNYHEKPEPNDIPPFLAPEFREKLLNAPMDRIDAKVVYDNFDTNLIGEESNGVKKLFAFLCPLIDIIVNGKVLICDELESGLHEALVYGLLKMFMTTDSGDKFPQLFFTTHDTGLLNLDMFRRDQIWFTELKEDRSTDLYSLAEIQNVRKDENIGKGYINGTYGAIPMLNLNFENIMSNM